MAVDAFRRPYGRLDSGESIDEFVLSNGRGVQVSIISYGAIITSVLTPDRSGAQGEVTLAHNKLEHYVEGHPYYGSLVGRVANRTSKGGISIDDTWYPLEGNSHGIHIHGGARGFNAYPYATAATVQLDRASVLFSRVSPDGEEGYPGNLAVEYIVSLTDDSRLIFDYRATTDAPTMVNLTNHTYWNLSGETSILDHELRLHCESMYESEGVWPTGRIVPTAGTPFDFSGFHAIGERVSATPAGSGYDHSFQVDAWQESRPRRVPTDDVVMRPAAFVRSRTSGRTMEVATSYPDLRFYSGNNLTGRRGRDLANLNGREALCLECQYPPDAAHIDSFPSIVLRPGEFYRERTEHRFGVDESLT